MAKQKVTQRDLNDSEWSIMQVVWEKQPITAPEVQECLVTERGWAYTTVKTMMDRMVKKDLLSTEKIRNLYLYSTTVTQEHAQKGELKKTLKRAFDGALTPMMQFLFESGEISDNEIKQLEAMIKEKRKTARAQK